MSLGRKVTPEPQSPTLVTGGRIGLVTPYSQIPTVAVTRWYGKTIQRTDRGEGRSDLELNGAKTSTY